MPLLFFGLITAIILFVVLAYIFIFSVQFNMSDDRSLFVKAFLVGLVCLIINGAYFLNT
tara:strand:- start:242 stop:418 length:177 start_codon:yes stop_codon:yes gene_type:complete